MASNTLLIAPIISSLAKYRSLSARARTNTASAHTTASSTYSLLANILGGKQPISTSRSVPPPTAVITASSSTPNRSAPRSMATIAPETANAAVPIHSPISNTRLICIPPDHSCSSSP